MTAPPPLPRHRTVPFEQKMAWILQLEDQRILRLDLPPPPPPVAPVKGTGRCRRPTPPPPVVLADLAVLVT